jgi:hypothetical protein
MQLSAGQIRQLRLRAQALVAPPLASATAVVARLVGVQAQEEAAARLAIWARSAGLMASTVDRERTAARTFVHTWAMRGTLHWVATEDLGWLLALLGPHFVRAGRRRRRQLGIDGETGRAAMDAIAAILAAEGALTRQELAARLAGRNVPTEGQAIYHLIQRAGLEGILCIGESREGQATYAPLAGWLGAVSPPAGGEDELLARLVPRYLEGYGPATPADFASWSGLPLSKTRAAFHANEETLSIARAGGDPVYLLPSHVAWLSAAEAEETGQVRLLPAYDAYLLGYKSRDLIVTPEHARRVHPGGGVIRPALLVNGVVRGVWRLERRASATTVVVEPFAPLAPGEVEGIAGEVARLGAFLSSPTSLRMPG